MPPAPTLPKAAFQSFERLYTLYLANTLKSALATFCATLLPDFEDSVVNDRPVANWLTVIYALSDQMPSSAVPYSDLESAANYIYKICFLTNGLRTQGLLTNAQAVDVLAAYNANF